MRQEPLTSLEALNNTSIKASNGANIHAVPLGLTVGTKPLIDLNHNEMTVATADHLTALTQSRDQYILLMEQSKIAYETVFSIRDSLKRKLGRKHSPAWDGSGFNQSLAVPRSVGGLLLVLPALKNFLTEKPELEVADVSTAAIADAALVALTASNGALTAKRSAVKTALNVRKQKEKKMRLRLRGIVEELNRVIGPLDARWEAFGLNQPGLKQAPPKPAKVTLLLLGNGKAEVSWNKIPRAEHHRVWLKVIGVDEDANPMGSPVDRNFTLENLVSGTQVEVSLSGVNNGGEGLRSEPVVVTVT